MPAAPGALVRTALRHAAARTPDLFARGARLVVGYSGGQDSTCLLHALAQAGTRGGWSVLAAHVDHALRPRSAADADVAARYAAAIGVPVVVRRVDVGAYRAEMHARHWSVQQAARAARYQALASVVAETGAKALLVAHTADDQAETLLLHLLRGAGLGGLAGMRPEERVARAVWGPPIAEVRSGQLALPDTVRLARPLLGLDRQTTLAYCASLRLPLVEDVSNTTRVYTRNRVRLDVLPALERVNPAARRALARTATLVADDLEALDAHARVVHAALARPGGGRVAYSLAAWRAQPRAIQRRVLRLGLERLLGDLADVPAAPVEDALDFVVAARTGRRTYDLPRGVRLVAEPAADTLRLDLTG